jgi:GH24 family phage-related lysozyme (muramidase)
LEGGYPLFVWTDTEVVCTQSSGYGNLATLKLGNGQVYQAGHLSACSGGNLGAGQIYGRVGTTGVSSGNHLHWNQKNNLGSLEHPQTNPLQATITGKWPGAVGGGDTGGIDMDFIKNLEGFHPTAYIDGSEGGRTRWSWGYGTKAPGPGQTISQEQAHQDMVAYLEANCLPHIPASLSSNQKTAAASLCYNVGPGVTNWSIWKEIEAGGNPNFTGYTRNTAGANLMPRRQKEQAMWDGQ